MPTSNAKRDFRSEDLVWVFLAELSVRDFLLDHDGRDESTAGYLFQTVRELGMQLACVENIAMLVTEFTKESPAHDKREGLEFPARIRIFCEKKIIDDANAAGTTSRPYQTEPTVEASETNEHIQECLSKLLTDYCVILVLIEIGEMSYGEVSTILKIPMGTVKSRLARARLYLRRELKAGEIF